MTHVAYILAAYLAAALILGGMVAWVVLDLSQQRRKLDRLEAEGRRRRLEVPR